MRIRWFHITGLISVVAIIILCWCAMNIETSARTTTVPLPLELIMLLLLVWFVFSLVSFGGMIEDALREA